MRQINKKIFLFLVLILGLTPLNWFLGKGNVLINGIDTNFPLNPTVWFSRRLYVWNASNNAGSDFSSSIAGTFFHLIQLVPYKLGLNLQSVQMISLVFWFMLIVLSSYLLARCIFPKKKLIQLLFVVLYSFNIYLFNSWENVKVANLSLVSAIPLVIWLSTKLIQKEISFGKASVFAFIVGIVLSGGGINPSYFISFFILLFLYFAGAIFVDFNKREIIRKLKIFVFISVIIIGANLFWIFPTMRYIFGNIDPSGSLDQIGFTNWIDSLSENTSLINVMRMQGAWDWYAVDDVTGLPLYIPYALNYFYTLPFIVFSFLLPSLVILSLIIRGKRFSLFYVSFSLMFIIGVFLGAGTNGITGNLFNFFLKHLPFFSLFRSPWYIFTPLLILSVAGLIGALIYTIDEKAKRFRLLGKFAINLFVLLLIVGNLFYSYPLITGKIFRPGRNDGFYVQFPDYVYKAGEWVTNNSKGRIIDYPDNEIQEFRWGYRGIESILALVADGEFLFAPLNAPSAPVSKLIKEFYSNVKKDQIESAKNIAYKLDAATIFEKKDQNSLSFDLPEKLKKDPAASFGDWNFYNLPQKTVNSKIFSSNRIYYAYPYDQSEKQITHLSSDEILLNSNDDVVTKINRISDMAGEIIIADNSLLNEFRNFSGSPSTLGTRLTSRDLNTVNFVFTTDKDGEYQPILERYGLEYFGLNANSNLEVVLDGKETRLVIDNVSDSVVTYQAITLGIGEHEVSLNFDNADLVDDGVFDFGGGYQESGDGDFEIVSENSEKYLSILNKSRRDISADFPVSEFDPRSIYNIQLRYHQVYGDNASVVMIQNKGPVFVKSQTERLPNYPEWNVANIFYEPVETESSLRIALVSYAIKDPLGTKIFYDELKVKRVFTNNLFFKRKANDLLFVPEVAYNMESPVSYRLNITNVRGPHIITFSENYSPEWQMDLYNLDGVKLDVKPLHFTSNLYANGWYVDTGLDEYKAEIYYKPQKTYELGKILTVLIFIGTLVVFGKAIIKKDGTIK